MDCHTVCSLAHHSPRQVCYSAVCLLIHKIAPSADSLSKQKSHHSYVKNRHNTHLLDFGNGKSAQQRSDNSSINCKSSIVYIEDFNGISAVIIPLKNAKVKSCSDYTCDYSYKNTVNKLTCIYIVSRRTFIGIQHSQQKTTGNDNSIPINMICANRKSNRIYSKFPPKTGKYYMIAVHN